jgi:hypothetical protein
MFFILGISCEGRILLPFASKGVYKIFIPNFNPFISKGVFLAFN